MINSQELKGVLRKAVAAILAFMLSMVLLVALLLGGFILLLKAATLGLTPWVGEAGAFGITGFVCVLLLALLLYRLTRPAKSKGHTHSDSPRSPVEQLRQIIRDNPWESVAGAFVLGVTKHTDPNLRGFILQSGAAYLKQAQNDERPAEEKAQTDDTETPAEDPGPPDPEGTRE
ncbi:hypothetical protein QQM79_12970 [Marinobacteraceae bacterium S3BR75-40.1]